MPFRPPISAIPYWPQWTHHLGSASLVLLLIMSVPIARAQTFVDSQAGPFHQPCIEIGASGEAASLQGRWHKIPIEFTDHCARRLSPTVDADTTTIWYVRDATATPPPRSSNHDAPATNAKPFAHKRLSSTCAGSEHVI